MTDSQSDVSGDLDSVELFAALREFLKEEAIPGLEGRSRFSARIANTLVGTLEREQALGAALAELDRQARERWGEGGDARSIAQQLARGLAERRIAVDSDLLQYLRRRQLVVTAINNPKYPSRPEAVRRWGDTAMD